MAFERLRAAFHRFLSDVRFALGAALAAVPVGAVAGALVPIPELSLLPQTAPGANRLLAITELALAAWFVGLLWGVLITILGRRLARAAAPRVRARAVLLAMSAAIVVVAPALRAHIALTWAAGLAAVAAAIAALTTLAVARERA
jgi:hypothetical protein